MTETKQSKFEEVYKIDCKKYIEKKGKLSYLSWANAWAEFKKIYPEATYTIVKNEHGKLFINFLCLMFLTIPIKRHPLKQLKKV